MQPKNEKSENVKVAVRIRPLTANELLSDAKQVFFSSQQDAIIYIENQNKQFTFDYVFGPDSTQEQIYSNSIVPLLDKFKNGFNTTIIAYGQTGSGKTFSMGTDKLVQSELQSDLDGVIPRVIRSLFSCLSSTNNPTGFKYSVSTSFLELHNEDLVDLLNPRPKSAGSWGGLLIREDSNGNIIWTGVREELVDGPEACLQSLQKGSLCRTTGSTDMNVSSSRSHAIFSIILKQEVWTPYDNVGNIPIQKEFDPVNFPDGTWTVYNSKFHFVDLAGDRKKEGISINQGLLSLGNVISALGDDTRKSSYIPFRDSKLTRLLQDSLGGNSQTLMLACISPSNTNYGESLNTLNYANRARNIKNRVTINQTSNSNEQVIALQKLVSKLQSELIGIPTGYKPDNVSWLESQLKLQSNSIQEYETKLSNLNILVKSRDFEIERLRFFQFRLYQRSNDLSRELSDALIQRDKVLIERVIVHDTVDNESRIIKSAFSNEPVRTKTPDGANVHVSKYMSAISDLRLKLANANDQLVWYKSVFESLGQSKRNEEDREKFNEIDCDIEKPDDYRISRLVSENQVDSDIRHERRFLSAIKNDPEFTSMLKSRSDDFNHTPMSIISPLASSNQTMLDDCTIDLLPQDLTPFGHQRSSSLYLLVDKIQNDIAEHEQVVSKLLKSETEYEVMKSAFEQKLDLFKNQLVQVQRERDLALQRMGNDTLPKDKAGTIAVKARFDKKHKNLELEIQELKNKLLARNSNKVQNENLTKTLMSTIQSLKAEKALMTRKLKQEAEKNRELERAKERELERIRKIEKKSDDFVKINERNQRASKSKEVMQILKRKPDEPSNKLPKQVLNLQDQMDFTSSNLGSPIGAKNLEPQEEHAPPLELRARFKKQMLDKELSGCLKQQRLLVRLDELKEERSRLIEEENELAAERERCMKIDLDSNSFDPESPYYMDDRLNLISSEMNMLDSRIAELEKDVEKPAPIEDSSVFTDSPGGSWENAENILNSLDNPEIQLVSKMFMKEAIDLKASGIEKDAKIVEKDKVILELRAAMENLRCAALKTAMQFEKKIQDIQENAKKVLETNIVSVETPLRIVPASVLSPNRNSLTPKPNWTEYSQDPSIAATAIVNNALSKIPRPEDSSEISPDGRSLTPLIPIPRVNNSKNYTISDVSTPNRHKSAPLDSSDKKPPILVSSYPIVTDLKKPSFPRRSPSPGKTTGINSKLEPLVRSFSVKPVSAIVDEGAVSVSDDDIQVWKDALIQLQKTEVDNENVYDRLHSKHTKSSRLKKI